LSVEGLDELLSAEGWPYASTPPVEAGDPGRYHALFGRDSLICALQVLPERPDVARATLRALAERQGRAVRAETHEEPGRIGHEFRAQAPEALVSKGWPERGEFRYYGTADATSWFLIVLAAMDEPELAAELEPAWRAAAAWLAGALERGDGLVRHGPGPYPGDLGQHGWRDTIDPAQDPDGGGILRPDGTAPAPPLADADSEAAAYAALRAAARLDPAGGWAVRAAALRERIGAAFGPEVMALEAGDVPVHGAGSQLGWLLWADALGRDARAAAAERLCAPDVLTDFGLRTLSSASPVFSPQAYHRGSVWPFDCWLGWGGLRACGRVAEAERVRTGVLAALDRLGRAPELYAVRVDGALEPLPLSNRVQAWTVGARWALAHSWDGRP
jgi:glycogen debranching enzyme